MSQNITLKKSVANAELVFKATNLSISTCTVITNLNSKINLGLLSRFINIHSQIAPSLDDKCGGVYNLEFYGNCARGETLIDRIKDEFNNQATIKFKYWGFRNVNIKIFANGKLQMTGLKYEDEAKEVANLLINIINNTELSVLTNINKLTDVSIKNDFQLVYDIQTKNVLYYRKYYDRFLKDYDFDTELVYNNTDSKTINTTNTINTINTSNITINLNRKGYVIGVHDKYNDTAKSIETSNKQFLDDNDWCGDSYIIRTIDKIEKIKDYFSKELEHTLSNAKTLIDVKSSIEELSKKYSDFKFPFLDKLIADIGKQMFSLDEQALIDVKHEVFKFNRIYKQFLEKKIIRLITIRTIDITICNYVNQYLINTNYIPNVIANIDSINLETLELSTKAILIPHNYFVSETVTVLINSNLTINHNINLKKMSKILKKLGLFNSFEPDEYPGVLTKYYYNPNNIKQGICNCSIHCSTREKHSICTKITISIFRPGSIIITGARNTIQLMSAHDMILKLMKENLTYIKGIDNDDDSKQIALMNNEFRKISRKPRLFFIKKTNISNYNEILDE